MYESSTQLSDLNVTLDLLERLVAFPSVSSTSNLDVVNWAIELFKPLGATFRRTYNEERSKSNLVISVGPDHLSGVILSGHVDVVPVEGQVWATDPFTLKRLDDRVYGRGTSDMKGFLACCIAQMLHLSPKKLSRPVHLALSYDEELGCLGAPSMVDDLAREIPPPSLVVVGEPTMMEIVTAHKGVRVYETCFKGHAAHSSQSHLGSSANVYAAEFVTFLSRTFEDLKAKVTLIEGLEPPYSTFNVGILNGGNALNIIPENARMVWEFRAIPEIDADDVASRIHRHIADEILPRLRADFPEAGIMSKQIAYVPALQPSGNRGARDALSSLTGLQGDGSVAFGTEAGIFQEAGFPTVVCGPGSIDVAHKANEHIALEQLMRCNLALSSLLGSCHLAP